MKKVLLSLLLLALSAGTLAVVETSFEFDEEQTRQRYLRFIDELRCPKCQNQNLAGSDAPIANDLRDELYRLLDEGYSDEEIVDFMVSRYGDYILYRPRLQARTVMLWATPALLLIVALVLVLKAQRRRRLEGAATAAATLSSEDEERLQRLLRENEK